MSNQLMEIKKYLLTDNIVKTVEDNYIEMLIMQNPKCKPSSIIEHINTIQLTGANPLLNQIYFIAYFSKKLGYSVGTTVLGSKFFELKASEHKDFGGCPYKIDNNAMYFNPLNGEETRTIKATATAHRKGREPFTFTAWYPEFVQSNFGKLTPNWEKMPYTMLRKCAIAGALRSQFAETVGGFLIEEEVNTEQNEDAEKIVQMESDIEMAVEKGKKEKIVIQKMKERPEKEIVIEEIKNLCSEITKGMKKDEKVEWLKKTLSVNNFNQLKDAELDYLKMEIDNLKKIKDAPIVINTIALKETD